MNHFIPTDSFSYSFKYESTISSSHSEPSQFLTSSKISQVLILAQALLFTLCMSGSNQIPRFSLQFLQVYLSWLQQWYGIHHIDSITCHILIFTSQIHAVILKHIGHAAATLTSQEIISQGFMMTIWSQLVACSMTQKLLWTSTAYSLLSTRRHCEFPLLFSHIYLLLCSI